MPKDKAIEDRCEYQIPNTDSAAGAMGRGARIDALKALTPNTPSPHKTLPFPAEIRRNIFGYLLHRSFNIVWLHRASNGYPGSLNILQVSSMVYQEAYDVLYDTATFKFDVQFGLSLRLVNGKSVKEIIPRIKHAMVISHLFPRSRYYRQAIKSTNKLICAVAQNGRLRSLELTMNEPGLERLATMEALRFLNVAIPTRIHFYPPFSSTWDLEKLDHTRAGCDNIWRTFLREVEVRNGPVEVKAVITGGGLVRIYIEVTLRRKKLSTQGAPAISRTNPRRLGRENMEAGLAVGDSL